MESRWVFRHQIGDAGFDPRSSRIKDLGEHSIKTFVREFIQNSLDVRRDKTKPVHISFNVRSMDDGDLKALKLGLGEEFLDMFSMSYEEAQLDEKEKLKLGNDILFNSKRGYSLIIKESNCVGLTGPEQITRKTDRSNYDALCRKVNTNIKDDINSGGTWGKGSSIYTYSSLIRTWFAYSILSEPHSDHKRRFVGRSQLAPFVNYNKAPVTAYFGEGWFCRKEDDESRSGLPLINDFADRFADLFSIPRREVDDYGTTFYIPAFNPNLDGESIESINKEILKQVLINWFIPLSEGKLTVGLEVEDAPVFIDKIFLNSIPQLKYKLEIMDWYSKGKPDDDRFFIEPIKLSLPSLKSAFQNTGKVKSADRQKEAVLDLVIRKLEDHEEFDDSWNTVNKVALVRGENGMFISHHFPGANFLSEQKIRTESILFSGLMSTASDIDVKRHADLFLAYAENPDHTEWCTEENKVNSLSYLERFDEFIGKGGKRIKPSKIIKDLLNNSLFNSFKNFFQESREIEAGSEINQLFQKLAALKVSGMGKVKENIVSIRRNPRFVYPEIDTAGRFIYHYIIRIIKEDSAAEVSLKPALDSWEGEISDFSELGVPEYENIDILDDETGKVIDAGSNPQISLTVQMPEIKVGIRTCSITSNPAFHNLQPKIKILVEKKEEL